MGTAAAIDGPPLALLYQNHRSEAIRATLATCFVLGTIMSAVALIVAGELRCEQVVFTLELLPALGVGLLASIWGPATSAAAASAPRCSRSPTIAGAAAMVRGLA